MKNKLLKKITKSLRGKLSLWYLLSVGLIIGLFLITSGMLFWKTLRDQIDHHVLIAVNEAEQIVEQFEGKKRDELIKTLVSAKGMTVVVLSPDGSPLLETNSPDVALVTEHQLQKISASSDLSELKPAYFTANNMRFAAKPVSVSAGRGMVAVGYSTKILQITFVKMLGVVIGIVVLLVLPLTWAGYKFLEIQLLPLEKIAEQAQAINSMDMLDKKISVQTKTKELMTIKRSLNLMLEKLSAMFEAERELFADTAHTLKTPLSVLRSQIENSSLRISKKRELLETIDATNETVSDLLFLAKIGKQKRNKESFSLSKLMENLTELATAMGEDNKLIVESKIQKDIKLTADRKLILRALSNIVHNAVIYNRPRGKIKLNLAKRNNLIFVEISDTGIGISKQNCSKVLNRFFRVSDKNISGSGLGLNIAKVGIESNGGKMRLSSKLGVGTKVEISFRE